MEAQLVLDRDLFLEHERLFRAGGQQGADEMDILLALVLFPFHPMSIKVSEKMIDMLCSCREPVPLSGIESQESLVHL